MTCVEMGRAESAWVARIAISVGGSDKLSLLRISRMMVDQLFLVLSDLPIELVHEAVDGRVHVLVGGFGEDRTTVYINFRFCFVSELFHRQYAVDA